jgi:hydrogenase nickel incorporation protein HypA/HybF
MHEMGIAMQILNIVKQSVPPEEGIKVKKINLKIGKLTAIVPQSMSFCMEIASKDTVAEGAEITYNEVPVTLSCDECQKTSEILEPPFKCGSCGSEKIEIIGGREMVVESIEIADPQ